MRATLQTTGLAVLISVFAFPLFGCAGADTSPASSESEEALSRHRAWLVGETKGRAEALTSLFENGTTTLQYAYVEDIDDGRGFTAGRAGFTTADGDALEVIGLYAKHAPSSPIAAFVPRLRSLAAAVSGSVVGLDGYAAAWASAAGDPAFRAAQDAVVDRVYFAPAMKRADALKLTTPLARAAVYDAIIQHGEGTDPDGLPALLKRTSAAAGGSPAAGVDEKKWLDAFLTVRRADLAHSFDPATRRAWSESVNRVDALRAVATSDNYALHGPIVVDSGDFRGTVP